MCRTVAQRGVEPPIDALHTVYPRLECQRRDCASCPKDLLPTCKKLWASNKEIPTQQYGYTTKETKSKKKYQCLDLKSVAPPVKEFLQTLRADLPRVTLHHYEALWNETSVCQERTVGFD